MSMNDVDRKFWDRWFPEGNNSEEIEPAKNVILETMRFCKGIIPKLGKDTRNELIQMVYASKNNSKHHNAHVSEQEDISHALNSLSLATLMEYAQSGAESVRLGKSALDGKRSKGAHKAAAKFQKFAICFNEFLQAYSGIVEVLKYADAQYGGPVSAVLGVFFTTAKLKADAEESIYSCMRQVADRLPDLKVYHRIYPDPSLATMLAEAYRDIIVFTREATHYFLDHTMFRVVRHLGKPLEFQKMEELMSSNFQRIKLRCETLLAEKIDHLSQQIDIFQQREDRNSVIKIRASLKIDNYTTDIMRSKLKEYREYTLRPEFDSDIYRKRMDLVTFHESDAGKLWTRKGSKLLLLFGANEIGMNVVHSWLSPVAVDLFDKLLRSQCIVAYEGCNPNSTLQDGISHLIYQLLEKNPAVLRRPTDFKNVESQLTGSLQSESEEERLIALQSVLLHVINLQEGSVFLILNRTDLCNDYRAQYVETMLSLVQDAKPELNVLMVQKLTWDWDLDKDKRNIRGNGSGLLHIVRMNQQRL